MRTDIILLVDQDLWFNICLCSCLVTMSFFILMAALASMFSLTNGLAQLLTEVKVEK